MHAHTRARMHACTLTHSHTHTATGRAPGAPGPAVRQHHLGPLGGGHWGAQRQGCRTPWSGPWLDTAVLKAPLFLRQAGWGGYPNWVRAIANQAHRPSPTRPTAQEGRHSDLWRHLAASSEGVTRDRASSLRSWRQSLAPLVADNGRARVRTAQRTPRPRLPEAPGPHSRPTREACGQGRPESLLRGLEISAPRNGRPQPAPLWPLRDHPPAARAACSGHPW